MLKCLITLLMGFFLIGMVHSNDFSSRFQSDEIHIAQYAESQQKKFCEQILLSIKQKSATPGLKDEIQALKNIGLFNENNQKELQALFFIYKVAQGDKSAIEQLKKDKFCAAGIVCSESCKICHGTGIRKNRTCNLCKGSGIKKSPINDFIKRMEKKYSAIARQPEILELIVANYRICGTKELPKNEVRAVELYSIAAKAGIQAAALRYAYCLHNGIGIKKNTFMAEKIIRILINQSYKPAFALWAMFLSQKKQYRQALPYFRQACYPYFTDSGAVEYNYSPFKPEHAIALSAAKCAQYCNSEKYCYQTVKLYVRAASQYQDPEAKLWIEEYIQYLKTPITCPVCHGEGSFVKSHNEVWDPLGRYWVERKVIDGVERCDRCRGTGRVYRRSYL